MNQCKENLINDLKEKPESYGRDKIIQLACRGHYSDFGSPLHFPMLTLVKHLKELGYDDMVQKVFNGDYDHDF
ncbi:hypothetical protein QKU48_gp1382 [Fadolivirus algeromassiliense]|jgi:hypothetical protein|uniref:Uncharacterized protein n=1 Tax=Fadolivirus FV1/VV64 TaxID=3070911 RepID=A0A7D3QXZ2_9VIRU|nr:hypothetical protein QKU48_gp1382 [Fadolivirus algeromassiliense]QKF94840.1 hypothetical protein Fadolivirus_1_1382 [Fadolivirus FV1/VV64]